MVLSLKKTARIVAVALALNLIAPVAYAAKPLSYQEIGNLYISSFGAIQSGSKDDGQEPKKPRLDITQLSDEEKRTLVFEILAKHVGLPVQDTIHEGMSAVVRDLDVCYGSGADARQNLINELDRTETIIGQAGLVRMVTTPLSDVKKLQARQSFIKELVENPELFEQMNAIVQKVKHAESGFFSFWRSVDPVTQKKLKKWQEAENRKN